MKYIYWIHLPEHTDILTEGYIGISKRPERRLWEHKNGKQNPHLTNALNKYKDITHTILLKGSEAYCYEIEEKLRPNPKIGWNLVPGGGKPPSQTGKKLTKEQKEKISKSLKGRVMSKGLKRKPLSDETKRKISLAHIGRKASKKARLNMSIAHKGHIPWNKGRKQG